MCSVYYTDVFSMPPTEGTCQCDTSNSVVCLLAATFGCELYKLLVCLLVCLLAYLTNVSAAFVFRQWVQQRGKVQYKAASTVA